MKTIYAIALFAIISVFPLASAEPWEYYELIDRLLSLEKPGEPVIFDNSVIFSAPSNLRSVGVAFSHENFTIIHWFRQLLITQDRLNAPIPPGKKVPDKYIDSGIQFHVFQIPENLNEVEYRMVINGLWTVDPANSLTRRDPVSGLTMSVLTLPKRPVSPNPLKGLPSGKGLHFTYEADSGEVVTIAGNFNGWDPFMYELKEGPAGVYSIDLPLPPGTYQYVFIHRGERHVDPTNPKRIYARDGRAASVIVVP
jgi:hypothetical protein